LGGGPDKRFGTVKIPYMKEVARLSSGKTFGELALQTNQPRTATAVCTKATLFSTIDKSDYQYIIGSASQR
jgi:CRP-like cAMP-binding protein